VKYNPRQLDPESADISRGHDRHPLRELALLLIGLTAICGALYLGVVLLTDFVVARISPATEGRVFAMFGHILPQSTSLDPELTQRKAMAEQLLAQLTPQADLQGLPVHLIVWDNDQTNAVALPGGTIALTHGLLRSLDNEVSMGFVLAHELGHFHSRDHLRGLGRQLGFRALMAVLFSSGADLQVGADQAGELVRLARSRKREAAADHYALDLVYRTLGTASGATRLFELLGNEKLPPWAYMLKTHPDATGRIAALRSQAQQLAAAAAPTNIAALARKQPPRFQGSQSYLGAITRGPVDRNRIALCFTAHEYAEGAEVILQTLARHQGKGSFFLTGDFLANTNFTGLTSRILGENHYVGPHSDKHLLYCSWERSRDTLVSKEEFRLDVSRNIEKIFAHAKAVDPAAKTNHMARLFMPPYEHYNAEIAQWTKELGMTLINYTPGTRSNADYTGEADRNFVPSQTIYQSIMDAEARDPKGLRGFMLLLHLGAGPGREDKFHTHFPQLAEELARKGYKFVTVEELLHASDDDL
jgi:Zn-dependent protease with chaperone function/peptidoglycan/xylan/chitin deacetylase (PgdA/CDA1 family)